VLLGVLGPACVVQREALEEIAPSSGLGEQIGEREGAEIADHGNVGRLDPDDRATDRRGDFLTRPFQEADDALTDPGASRVGVTDAEASQRGVEDIVKPTCQMETRALDGRKSDTEMLAPIPRRSSLCR
jgi:hypothetical protein